MPPHRAGEQKDAELHSSVQQACQRKGKRASLGEGWHGSCAGGLLTCDETQTVKRPSLSRGMRTASTTSPSCVSNTTFWKGSTALEA